MAAGCCPVDSPISAKCMIAFHLALPRTDIGAQTTVVRKDADAPGIFFRCSFKGCAGRALTASWDWRVPSYGDLARL